MAETQLINIADVRSYRLIDSKFDVTKFNSFCNEVQRTNLRNLLGGSLYKAFMDSDRINNIYTDVLNGKEYTYNGKTIQFYGIKPILVYWWLALATREGDLFLGTIGAIQFVNNQQQSFESAKEKEKIAQNYTATAQGYANDLIQFLDSNSKDYPLWTSDAYKVNSTNFITFKV